MSHMASLSLLPLRRDFTAFIWNTVCRMTVYTTIDTEANLSGLRVTDLATS